MNIIVRDKKFYKALIVLATPMILQSMITIGVNIMDTVMLGKMGEVQLSASSLANNFFEIFMILNMGIGGGAGVLISQYWGMDDKKSIKKVVSIMFRICLSAALLFTVVSIFFPSNIMSLYSKDPGVIEKGRIYILWSLPTFFLMGCSLVMTLVLRSVRKVMVPFIASCVSFFVNVFFNWVFIFGKLGAPRMEIAGAALGTVIARVAEFLIIGVYFLCKEKDIGFKVRDILIPSSEQLPVFLKYGTPVIISDLLLTFGNNGVSIIMGHIGTNFVAAFAIVAPVMRLCNVASMGLSQASATMTGNAVGGKTREEAFATGFTCFLISIGVGVVASLLLLAIGEIIIGIYSVTAETHAIALELIDVIALILVFQAVQSVLTKGVLRGGGDTRFCMVADVIFLWVLSIPLGYVCGLVLHTRPFITYLALKSDFIMKSALCIFRLLSGKWIKRVK
ncbi:MAG: MATE family efflux transporter [Spirochaetales bacterium]|nr:MATE family efflux transporter [Spirochaetales bacterium]